MTSTTAPSARGRTTSRGTATAAPTGRGRRPDLARTAAAAAHLAVLALVGPVVLTVVLALLGVGIGLLPVLGLGLLLLLALPYVLLAVGWVETARVDGLYDLGLPPLRARPRTSPGFGGALRAVWHQAGDAAMWRAVGSAALATLLGLLLLPLAGVAASAAAAAVAPLYARGEEVALSGLDVAVPWAPLVGGVVLALALAGVVGLALLHGVVTRALLRASREAQLVEAARASDTRRAGAVRAAAVERARIERDLHDGVQPRLVAVGMTLGMAKEKLDDPVAARALIEEAHTGTKAAITELRQLARGIHASVLDDRGLDAALSAVVARSHVPVDLDVRLHATPDVRCGRTAEAAVYFAVAEALTNAAKHSRAARCRVVVRHRDGGVLWARVEDDGVGGARVLPGGGLDGIANRVAAAGGSCRLDSPRGGPTSLEVGVPCAS